MGRMLGLHYQLHHGRNIAAMVNKSHVVQDEAASAAHSRLPPLNALRSFEAVARRGSFAAAAVDLNVTHWAVGKQIRLLEDWFGLPLFERRPRGVELTDEGAALLDDVGAAFERLSGGADRLRGGRPERQLSGVVRVNALVSFALHWLLPRLPDFQARYPGIQVRVSTTSRKLRYIGDAFDVGVRSGPEEGAGLISQPLMADVRLPACSPALLRQHPIRAAADLARHTLLHSASTRGAWALWLDQAGEQRLRPARNVEFEHVFLQQAAALEGLGVTLASLPLIERDLSAGRLVCPFSGPALRASEYTMVVPSEQVASPAVETFKHWMLQAATGTCAELRRRHDEGGGGLAI